MSAASNRALSDGEFRSACVCPVNEAGDIRCHKCGEYVNKRCWTCGTPRGEGKCPTVAVADTPTATDRDALAGFRALAAVVHRGRCRGGAAADCKHWDDPSYFTPKDNDIASELRWHLAAVVAAARADATQTALAPILALVAEALEATYWDRPYDTRLNAIRACLQRAQDLKCICVNRPETPVNPACPVHRDSAAALTVPGDGSGS